MSKKNETPNLSRRQVLARGGVAVGGLAAFAAGYSDTVVKAVQGLGQGTAGVPTAHATRGNSLQAEFRIDPMTGLLDTQPGQVVSPSSCLGCWTQCGVRVRIDTENNTILRIAGNPYHPLATTQPAVMDQPVREVYAMLGGENGLEGRASACARGASMLAQHASPYRVLAPLKRVGPRGSGQWQRISFEQLIAEVCDGGDLFGEGQVDGLRAIWDHNTPIDPQNPEFGPLANQLLFTDAANEGRTPLVKRFAEQAFGTVNVSNHGSYCGQSFRVGTGAALGDLKGMPHGKPDWKNARFGLFIGAAPAQSGNPFQRQGRELAEARARKENTFRYVVVSPILPTSSSLASGSGNRWQPVLPGSDLSLVMGMLRWILEQERFDRQYLARPHAPGDADEQTASWTNATHLLIADPEHPGFGRYLRATDLGWEVPQGSDAAFIVMNEQGELRAHTDLEQAELFVERKVLLDDQEVQVCTALHMLRERTQEHSLEHYAQRCGLQEEELIELAREFTSHGRQAVADAHGGTMNGSGFYTAYAIAMLNTLVGNLNVKGGLVLDAGPFGPFGPGPRYNFAQFPGKVAAKGVALSRHRFAYEKSSEYQRRKEKGEALYPAPAPWYPAVGGLSSEMIASGLNGYPYSCKVWINHMSNPVYAIAGFKNAMLDKLKDPTVLPLSISINPFINETNAYADYIVPDTVTYESWGVSAPWADVIAKSSTLRWPVVQPRVERTADGQPINLESFLFAVALRLALPGFGKGVLKDKSGQAHDLLCAEDFYLRGMANIAFGAGRPVGNASDDDMRMTGVDRLYPELQARLHPEEQRKVAMLLSRGGRFDRVDNAWKGDQLKKRHDIALQVWNEDLARMRHSMTGERLSGCPSWYPTRLADGSDMREHFNEQDWPFLMSSYKSNLMSSMSIGMDRLRQVHPHNPISLNQDDAGKLGIRNGDPIRVSTPGGSVDGVALVRGGIMRGAIAIEHGFGHTELGARSHTIDGQPMPHQPAFAAGVNLNELGFADPTRAPGQDNVWIDWVSGAAVRQGLPARIEKRQV
ncbi:MAG TPA: tetrathionate reductase subunit A [Alcaligenes sp.]|nr:tetrathionate reductase subunit A [Alcaligenes sp.]HRL27067.1 tetrathionate reductase subunit A [Alcaligenes sp.]